MKYFFIIVVFLVFIVSLKSQTYIGPNIGIDYIILEPGSTHPSTTSRIPNGIGTDQSINIKIGARFEQYFTEMFSLTLSATYSEINYNRMRPEGILGPAILTDNSFKRQEYIALVNYNVWNSIYVGVGGSFSKHDKLKSGEFIGGDNQREYGAVFSSYYRYRNFMLELRYNHGLLLKEPPEDLLVFMRPTRSLSLSVSYMFQVLGPLKRKNGKALECPKF